MQEQEQIEEIEMEEAKELPLVEEGDFKAKVVKVETNVPGNWGPMLVFHFDVGGTLVPALCSQNLNENTKLFTWAKILAGKELKVGDKLRFKDFIGKQALVTVRSKQVKNKDGTLRTADDGTPVLTSNIKELRQAK